jgi:hypothetical protein
MSIEGHTKPWFEKLKGCKNYRSWTKNMIFLFETEDVDEVVFNKIPKPERPSSAEGLDKFEFEQRIIRKRKLNKEDRQTLYDHYESMDKIQRLDQEGPKS